MMRGASGDECGKLLGQEYNRPAEAGVLKKPREATLTLYIYPDLNRNKLEQAVQGKCCLSLFYVYCERQNVFYQCVGQ
jgi:hypothetical protein